MQVAALEKKLPFLSLKTNKGVLALKDFLPKKALLFYFISNHQEPAALKLINDLNLKRADLGWLDCEVILVTDLPVDAIQTWTQAEEIYFTVASDEGDNLKTAFIGEPDKAALILFDRYGSLHWWIISQTDADLPSAEAVFNEILYLSSQCPECGV